MNILAAVGIVYSLGFSIKGAVKSLSSFRAPSGRLQEVTSDIFVDYAHTPDALNNSLKTLNAIGYKKIFCIFGCGGDRDKGKRIQMGRVAQRYADFSIITSDNPRSEDPLSICRAVAKGFNKRNYSIVLSRKKAITKGVYLKQKEKGSCILVAGKGHEDYQILGNKKIPFKDSRIIKEVVRKV